MGNIGGRLYLHVLLDIEISCYGYVQSFSVRAARRKSPFLSFWNHVDNETTYELASKIQISVPNVGVHTFVNLSQQVWVTPGQVIGLHYSADTGGDGLVNFVNSLESLVGTDYSSVDQLSRLITVYARDTDLPIGTQHSTLANLRRQIPLRLHIREGKRAESRTPWSV